jgi:hypothetical protein
MNEARGSRDPKLNVFRLLLARHVYGSICVSCVCDMLSMCGCIFVKLYCVYAFCKKIILSGLGSVEGIDFTLCAPQLPCLSFCYCLSCRCFQFQFIYDL